MMIFHRWPVLDVGRQIEPCCYSIIINYSNYNARDDPADEAIDTGVCIDCWAHLTFSITGHSDDQLLWWYRLPSNIIY